MAAIRFITGRDQPGWLWESGFLDPDFHGGQPDHSDRAGKCAGNYTGKCTGNYTHAGHFANPTARHG
jgi:hypothetical protein